MLKRKNNGRKREKDYHKKKIEKRNRKHFSFWKKVRLVKETILYV